MRRDNYFTRKIDIQMQKKLVILFAGSVLAFIALLGRILYINVNEGDRYARLVLEKQNYNSRVIPFQRGSIEDRNGTKLAESVRVYNVILDSVVLLSNEKYMEPTLDAAESCFGIEKSDIKKAVDENRESPYHILKKGISYEEARTFREKKEDEDNGSFIQGIWLEEDYIRNYPFDTLACGILGFANQENQGNYGVEATYNQVLNGTNGREYGYINDSLAINRTVIEPVNGKRLVLTLDYQAQSIVEKHVKSFNEKHRNEAREGEGSLNTSVIVMNPQNGEILAMASYPDYNLNQPMDLTKYYSQAQIDAMTEEEKSETLYSLWKNYCISNAIEPGSVFKPFVVSAGLETGVLDGSESFYCGGGLYIGGYNIMCHNTSGHGGITLKQAIEYSCNVALMDIAGRLGPEKLIAYQKQFGFGRATGIDLPGEEIGILYTTETMDDSSLATNGFGQNFNMTMIQMASAFCSMINGGDYYRPHVVKEIRDSQGNLLETKNPVVDRKTISPETSVIIRDYMRGVVTEGTGTPANIEGYDVGGKTGTSEKHPRGTGKHILSFAGYAPQEKPEVLIYVVIDEVNAPSQTYSGYVTELSAEIMRELFPYLGITKSE